MKKFDDAYFETRYAKDATDDNRAKVFGEHAAWVRAAAVLERSAARPRALPPRLPAHSPAAPLPPQAAGVDGADVDEEMWPLDEPPPPSAIKKKFRESMGGNRSGEEATELQIGALRNCYLVRGAGVDVYKNTEEGLCDEGVSLRLRDAAGADFTPQKALLARGEANLLLLTPNTGGGAGRAHSVFQFGARDAAARAPLRVSAAAC